MDCLRELPFGDLEKSVGMVIGYGLWVQAPEFLLRTMGNLMGDVGVFAALFDNISNLNIC